MLKIALDYKIIWKLFPPINLPNVIIVDIQIFDKRGSELRKQECFGLEVSFHHEIKSMLHHFDKILQPLNNFFFRLNIMFIFFLISVCNCNTNGVTNTQCADTTGQCPCSAGYTGQQCRSCASNYYSQGNLCLRKC